MNDRLKELVESGFFNDCEVFKKMFLSKGGKIDLERLESTWDVFQGRKYCMKYYMTHGDIMPTFGLPEKYQDPKFSEDVYKKCLETGETWQEETDYEPPPEGELW